MASEAPVDLIEHQQWLEPVETGVQKAVGSVFESAGPAGQKLKNFLHGVWLGHPLHPVLTDIPIGAWTAAFILDLMDSPEADTAVAVGLVGAVGSAVTGLTDWQATDGPARRVGVFHGLLNTISATLYTASLIQRKRRNRTAGRALAFSGYAVSMMAAYLGGNLVYSKQIGVSHTAALPIPHEWTPILAESELREGEPRRVDLNGVRFLLLKRTGQVYCIVEVCSHLGGPLAEGEIRGDTVKCPWHGSRFSLHDGSVIDGPATHPQPCFETRVRNGQIEICGREQE